MIEYTLTRSKRKTVAIYIRGGGVEVKAPLKATKSDIDKHVISKEKWITSKLAQFKESAEQRENFSLDYGDTVIYRGKQYPIIEKIGNRAGFDEGLGQFCVPPNMTCEQIKHACTQIYRMLAKRVLTERVSHFSTKMRVYPTSVKVNGATSKWGSCSIRNWKSPTQYDKNINFSWRLIMADDDVIDYVVVHELAHIYEMSHNAKFWEFVEYILPDYRERKAKLKELQNRINSENWL